VWPEGIGVVQAIDGASLRTVLSALRWSGVPIDKPLTAATAKAFARVDQLTGKSVRITYRDGGGVRSLEAMKGPVTDEERDFHMSSVIVADALILGKRDRKTGEQWTVEGRNFAAFVDPSF